jgi:hypothetical protein
MRENTTEVEAVLKEFFQLQDDGWHNERADAEIAKYKSFGEAGKRGAAKRWGNREANGEATSPPNPTPIATNNHKPKTNKPIPVGFEEFWKAYPRKIAKPQAEKAWAKICPDEELNKRIHKALSVAKQSKDWTKDGGQYIPYPATWLNQNRWEDEHGTSEGGVNWDEVLKEAV